MRHVFDVKCHQIHLEWGDSELGEHFSGRCMQLQNAFLQKENSIKSSSGAIIIYCVADSYLANDMNRTVFKYVPYYFCVNFLTSGVVLLLTSVSSPHQVFDAVICDPPYGVRAGGRKSGGRKLLKGVVDPYTVPDDKRRDHIPSTAPYSLAECMHDLLDLAAKMLVMGGRLVFFYPVVREDGCTDAHFPEHPCFALVASCEQILSLRYSRYLLTMVKTGAYTEAVAELAKKKHIEFKENHLKWLEDGNLHSAVFSPAGTQEAEPGKSYFDRDAKPKYRGKYV